MKGQLFGRIISDNILPMPKIHDLFQQMVEELEQTIDSREHVLESLYTLVQNHPLNDILMPHFRALYQNELGIACPTHGLPTKNHRNAREEQSVKEIFHSYFPKPSDIPNQPIE